MADFFCLIFPDAIFNGKAGLLVQQFENSGIQIKERVTRQLSLEETAIVFHNRRFSQNFDKFCLAISSNSVWLLHLSTDKDLAKLIEESIHSDLYGEFLIPSSVEENDLFLHLLKKGSESKKDLPEIIAKLRSEYNKREDLEVSRFAVTALKHGRKLFTYFTSMKINGFNEEQAFSLTQIVSDRFIKRKMEDLFLSNELQMEEFEDLLGEEDSESDERDSQ
jgi:hypothetical protein